MEPREGILISARTGMGLDRLRQAIADKVSALRKTIELVIPYDKGAALSLLHEKGQMIQQEYLPQGVRVECQVDAALYQRVLSMVGQGKALPPSQMRLGVPAPLQKEENALKLISWNVNGLRPAGKRALPTAYQLGRRYILSPRNQDATGADGPAAAGLPAIFFGRGEKGLFGHRRIDPAFAPGSDLWHWHRGARPGRRVITCFFDRFTLVNCYTPNAQNGLKRLITGCVGRMTFAPI